MKYDASYKEYIFSKNFSNCVTKFKKFFDSEVRVIDEHNLDPYTECIFIFIQSASMNGMNGINGMNGMNGMNGINSDKCVNNDTRYKVIDPVAHSYTPMAPVTPKTTKTSMTSMTGGTRAYNFCESMRIKILERLMDIVQKKLGLYRIYEIKVSTTNKLKSINKLEEINKSVVDILHNYLQVYSDDIYVKNLLILCKNSAKISNAEEIQKEIIESTKASLHNTVNKLYDFYCNVRLLDPIATTTWDDGNKGKVELVHSGSGGSGDFYTLQYVIDRDIVDTINFNIHTTRVERLRDLYKKSNKNYDENNFLDCLYACIRRYRTIFWQHRVFFGNSMPPKTFELWKNFAKGDGGNWDNGAHKDGRGNGAHKGGGGNGAHKGGGDNGAHKGGGECFADPFNSYHTNS